MQTYMINPNLIHLCVSLCFSLGWSKGQELLVYGQKINTLTTAVLSTYFRKSIFV